MTKNEPQIVQKLAKKWPTMFQKWTKRTMSKNRPNCRNKKHQTPPNTSNKKKSPKPLQTFTANLETHSTNKNIQESSKKEKKIIKLERNWKEMGKKLVQNAWKRHQTLEESRKRIPVEWREGGGGGAINERREEGASDDSHRCQVLHLHLSPLKETRITSQRDQLPSSDHNCVPSISPHSPPSSSHSSSSSSFLARFGLFKWWASRHEVPPPEPSPPRVLRPSCRASMIAPWISAIHFQPHSTDVIHESHTLSPPRGHTIVHNGPLSWRLARNLIIFNRVLITSRLGYRSRQLNPVTGAQSDGRWCISRPSLAGRFPPLQAAAEPGDRGPIWRSLMHQLPSLAAKFTPLSFFLSLSLSLSMARRCHVPSIFRLVGWIWRWKWHHHATVAK